MNLAVFYHCKISGEGIPDSNYALNIVAEQMGALKRSGLADAAAEIHLGINGGDADALTVSALGPEKAFLHVHPPGSRSELPTLAVMRRWLPEHRDWLVCYHHSKGVTMMEWGRSDPEYKANHRRTMEKFVIWNWRQCVADLESGYQAVGCNLVDPIQRPVLPGRFFAGNFWWARSDYLLTLPSINDNAPNYTLAERCSAEGWIGGDCSRRVRFMDYERPDLYR